MIVTPHVTSPFLKRSTIIKAAKFFSENMSLFIL